MKFSSLTFSPAPLPLHPPKKISVCLTEFLSLCFFGYMTEVFIHFANFLICASGFPLDGLDDFFPNWSACLYPVWGHWSFLLSWVELRSWSLVALSLLTSVFLCCSLWTLGLETLPLYLAILLGSSLLSWAQWTPSSTSWGANKKELQQWRQQMGRGRISGQSQNQWALCSSAENRKKQWSEFVMKLKILSRAW